MRTPLAVLLLASLCHPGALRANPTGGRVVAGQAAISTNGSTLTVNQLSDRAILHWQDFSIPAGNTTTFVQPSAASAALNRVTGGNPSALHGRLQANGRIYLVNPNGILVGPGGVVDTAGFLASTLDVSDSEFLSGGDLTFKGGSAAAVVNLGKIGASEGDVILIARTVENHGEIDAPRGTAALAAGNEVLVKASGEERVFVQPESGRSDAQVNQAGKIRAATAELKAAGGNEYSLAIRHGGETRATGVERRGGRVFLSAGGKGGIAHSGTIAARQSGGGGGRVKIEAQHVELAAGSRIDASASGKGDGGEVLVGGGYQGQDATLRNAETVTVEEGALIISDAASEGKGGTVIVWSDDTTVFGGTISARGGDISGDGGFAEVSGKNHLSMSGFADLRAANGAFGTLLLDPGSVSIVNGPSTNAGFDTFNDAWIADQLSGGHLTIATSNSTNGGTETITIDADVDITWSQPTTLTLDAGRNIVFNFISGPAAGYTGPGRVGSSTYVEGATFSNTYSGGNFDAIVLRANQGPTPTAGVIGINLRGATLSTVSGNIDLAGAAAGGSAEAIVVSHGGFLNSTGNGNIVLNGQGGRSGVRMFYGVSGGPRAQIDVTDGDLTITGIAGDGVMNHAGVFLDAARLNSNGSGDIVISGRGGLGSADADRRGAWIFSTDFTLQSTGSLEIEAIAGSGDSHGLFLQGGAGIVHSGTGSITLKGQGVGSKADIFSNVSVGGASAQGDISLVADSLEWTGGTIRSTGNLQIQPRTLATGIGVAGGTGDLQLDVAFLNRLQDGFSSIAIGHEDGTGTLAVGSYTFKDNVILRTPKGNGDIVLNGALATGSGTQAGTITLQAGRSIIGTSGGGRSIATQGQAIVLNADRDQTGGGNIQLTGTTIASNGGAIVLGGGTDPLSTAATGIAATNAATKAGIYLNGSTLTSGAGAISLLGQGVAGTSNAYGIHVFGGSKIGNGTGTGSITLHGTGGNATVAGSSANHGVVVSDANTAISSSAGAISVTGRGGQSANGSNYGILVSSAAQVASTGTATVALDGTGGVGAARNATLPRYDGNNFGVYMLGANTLVTSVSGDVSVIGKGGGGLLSGTDGIGGLNRGIYMITGAKVTSTGTGANAAKVTLHGTGGSETQRAADTDSFTAQNMGVYLMNAGTGVESVDGDIEITGIGLPGTSNYGVFLYNGTIIKATGDANMHLIGEGSVDFTLFAGAAPSTLVSNTGDIVIEANTWSGDGASSGSIEVDTALPGAPKGRLIIRPRTAGTTIGLGSGAGTLSLTAVRQAFIKDGFSEVVIGSETAGNLTANAATFTDPLRLVTGGNLALNGALNTGTNRLALLVGGNTTQTAALTAGSLRLGGNGHFTLENAANSIGTLAKDGAGSVSLRHSAALTVGTVDGVNGVAGSTVDLRTTAGNLILNQAVTGSAPGNAVVLSTPGAFVNNAGASGVSTPAGRWLIYSNAPAGNTFGGLLSGQTALWNRTIGAHAPSSISQTGNRYLFVQQPSLTVTATLTDSKSYGETYGFPAPVAGTHYAITGFVDASAFGGAFLQDTAATIGLSGAPTLASAGAAASAPVAGSPYVVTIAQGTLNNSAGYQYGTFASGGGITVIPRALTITADAGQGKIYGNPDPTLTYTVGGMGLVGADSLSGTLARAAGENVGSYAINQGTLTAGGNYDITYVGANFGITPRSLTITADAGQGKIYGNPDPTLTYTVGGMGLVGADSLSGTLARAAGENVGSYAVNQGTLTAGGNYDITYLGANFGITPRAITITAGAGQGKIYGNPDPTLTYTVGGMGLVGADSLNGALARAAGENVGNYAIQQGTLTAGGNYVVTYIGNFFGIAQRPVTVTVTPGQNKVYGTADPRQYLYTHTSLGSGVPLKGRLSRAPGERMGRYAIGRGTLTDAANPNYAITFVGGTFTIGRKTLTIAALDAWRFVHQPNPPLTFVLEGFQADEGLADLEGSLGYLTEADYYSPAGVYPIHPAGVSSANYEIAFAGGVLTVVDNPLLLRDFTAPVDRLDSPQEDEEEKGKIIHQIRKFPAETISSLSSGEVAAGSSADVE